MPLGAYHSCEFDDLLPLKAFKIRVDIVCCETSCFPISGGYDFSQVGRERPSKVVTGRGDVGIASQFVIRKF